MSLYVEDFISGWIRKSENEGSLKNTPYHGKELDFGAYFETPTEHRLSMKILKNANCLPPAVELMQVIAKKIEERNQSSDLKTREKLKKEIIILELKRDVLLQRQ